jgi:hypothetical protein
MSTSPVSPIRRSVMAADLLPVFALSVSPQAAPAPEATSTFGWGIAR